MPKNRTITGELFQVPRGFALRESRSPYVYGDCPACGAWPVRWMRATKRPAPHEHGADVGRVRRRICFGRP